MMGTKTNNRNMETAREIIAEYGRRNGSTRLAYGLDAEGEVAVSDGAQLPPLAVEVIPQNDGTAVFGPDLSTDPAEWTTADRQAMIESVAAYLSDAWTQ